MAIVKPHQGQRVEMGVALLMAGLSPNVSFFFGGGGLDSHFFM